MNIPLIINIVVFIGLIFLLAQTRKTTWSLSKKVLAGLVLGGYIWTRITRRVWRKPPSSSRIYQLV